MRVALPLASLTRDHFLVALARGRESFDWAGMASVIREEAGLPPTRAMPAVEFVDQRGPVRLNWALIAAGKVPCPVSSSPHPGHPRRCHQVASFHRGIVDEAAATVAREPWVVVGMAQNPFVRKARRLLESEGIAFTYLEYGSYFSGWKKRLAIKLWAGFPTFPMVFRDGVLLGGYTDLVALKPAAP